MCILISLSFSKTLCGTQARIFTWWDGVWGFFFNRYMKWILNKGVFFPSHTMKKFCIWTLHSIGHFLFACEGISWAVDYPWLGWYRKPLCCQQRLLYIKCGVFQCSGGNSIIKFPINSTWSSTLYCNYGRCKNKKANAINNQGCEHCPVTSFSLPLLQLCHYRTLLISV